MKLYEWNIKMLAQQQSDKVNDAEINIIKKKSGHNALRFYVPLFTVILFIAIPFSWVAEHEIPVFYILVFVLLFLPLSLNLLKKGEVYACYGVVTDKTIRCAKVSGRGSRFLPYEKTEETGTYKRKYSLFYTVCDFYYCTVEINGQIYENVYCKGEDFPKINVGDTVIISINAADDVPVIYACSH